MSIINYIENLAGKDKLEIEFKIHDYISGRRCYKSNFYERKLIS